jgi:Xaa-Pro aminopeptidase
MPSEVQIKQQRLAELLDRHHLDGVLLTQRNNFSWITCGRDNHVANGTPNGVATIFATRDSRTCFANTIEAPRIKSEEMEAQGIEVIDFPWYDRAATEKRVREVVGDKRVAGDVDTFGLPAQPWPGEFGELRWTLTAEEIARYRDGAGRASAAMERACRQLKHAMREHEIAGVLDHEIHNAGLNPVVTLVAADERIAKFRHAIPTEKKAQQYVMLVTCADFGGLITSLTRFVSFGPLPAELKAKQQAVCDVDAAVNHATRPGRTFGEIFTDLQAAYARVGHGDQWKLHHQGGSAGYAPREAVAVPGSGVKVLENQAFAWNPSITGTKSEDTTLCTAKGIEVLSAHSNDWPSIIGRAGEQTLRRADVLIL